VKINDAVVGAIIAVLGIVILAHVQGYPTIPGQKYGPALFPGIAAAGFVICGCLLVMRGVRERRAGGRWVAFGAWARSPQHVGNFLAIVAALVFYIAAAETLGFLITATLLLVGLFLKFGVRLALAAPVALVAAVTAHLLFYKLMRVPLPWGVLEPFAW